MITVLLLVTFLTTGSNAQEDNCNRCNQDTGFVCASDTQYFLCDKTSGAIDISSFATCAETEGICDFTETGTIPCSLSGNPPTCPNLPFPTLGTTTTPGQEYCNQCDLNTGFACASFDQYFLCDKTTGAIDISSFATCAEAEGICDVTYPGTTPCSLNTPPSCPYPGFPTIAPVTTTTVAQEYCSICDANTGFACFSDRQYFLCDKTTGELDMSSFTTCETGICNMAYPGTTPCTDDAAPSCPNPALPTIPPLTTLSPNDFCTGRNPGRYPYGTDCTQYMYCYLVNGVIHGGLYICSGQTLFNPTSLLCVSGFTCPTA